MSYATVLMIVFIILISAHIMALFFRMSGFRPVEIVLLVAFPMLAYISVLPMIVESVRGFKPGISSTVFTASRVFDVPLFHVGTVIVGFNVIGCTIPLIITVKMLLQKRVIFKQFLVVALITAGVTYLYSIVIPANGISVYLFAIPPILAAAVAFMIRRMPGSGDFNPALLSYAGATIGVLAGADLLNLHTLLAENTGNTVFISIGGGNVLDAIFLAGIVALFADLIFRSQEEGIMPGVIRLFKGDKGK